MKALARVALRLWGRLLPGEFRDSLLGDVLEGLMRARRRSRWAAFRWLAGEIVRTPYLSLWRQARRLRRREAVGAAETGRARGTDPVTTMRVCVRVLWKRPAFTGVAVGTLALSIGAATLIFALLEAVLLRPLPYPEADRLFAVYGTNEAWREGDQEFLRRMWNRAQVSQEMLRSWNALGPLEVGGYQPGSAALTVGDGPTVAVSGARIGEGFFATLGAAPLLGRIPSLTEHRQAEPVVVIAERLWARDFGRDPGILGRTVTLEGVAHTIVGVMPASFAFPSEQALWWSTFPSEWIDFGHATILNGVARLSLATDSATATESMEATVDGLASEEPSYSVMGVRLTPLREQVLGSVREGLTLLFGAVCVVVLIACVNLANLVVARGARRMPELALRAALGAGRSGLVAATLSEVGVVCLAGALLGVGLATAALDPLVGVLTWAMPDFPRTSEVSINLTVLAFSLAVTILTALLAGLPPALAAAGRAPARVLQSAQRGARSRRLRRVQSSLLFIEAGLAMLLLAGAGLLTRSTAGILTLDPGFESRGVGFLALQLPEERFPEEADALRALDELEARLARVPGVHGVTGASPLPALGGSSMVPVRPQGAPPGQQGLVVTASVGPAYFTVLSIPLLAGRPFEAGDDANANPVAILGASLARDLFGDEDPVGRFIVQASGAVMVGGRTEAGSEETVEVVGVVGDVRQLALVGEAEPVLYRPMRQALARRPVLAMATTGDPRALLEPAGAAAAEVDGVVIRDRGVFRSRTLELLGPIHLRTLLLGVLSALAACLAMVGVYGVVSYVVSDQRREIGIRVALGARSGGEITRMVRAALAPTLAGALVGIVGALALSRTLESSIYEISRLDPLAYAGTFALLVTVAVLASWWPARRATSVDPIEVLNQE